ncbi:MAG TPA: hypoxanthine phosphoribosyltransferase [Actinomycetota bacterium]|nr:hypoxanthine phosphoribosyltransferase [Actinomycetota bacterium]
MTNPTPIAETLVDARALAARIHEIAAELDGLYGSGEPPVLIAVLKGSTLFLADLIRAMRSDVAVDFMAISSYQGSRGGVVRIIKDVETDLGGRDVVIVEDIVDTGLTLNFLRRTLEARGTRSLTTVTLLDKAARRIVPVPVEIKGFEIGDVFVVGYGLDFQGRYRNLPDLLAVRDIARLASDPDALVPALFDGPGC